MSLERIAVALENIAGSLESIDAQVSVVCSHLECLADGEVTEVRSEKCKVEKVITYGLSDLVKAVQEIADK